MSRTRCNASIPRPGHTGERLSCSILIIEGGTHHYSDHWHPIAEGVHHGRGRYGYSWRDDTGGAQPHDPTTAVALELEDAGDTGPVEPTGVRFTRVEVQRMIAYLGDGHPADDIADVRRVLETRLAEHDTEED